MGGEVIDSLQGQINLTSAFSSYLIKHAALHSLLKSDMGLEKEVLCYSVFFFFFAVQEFPIYLFFPFCPYLPLPSLPNRSCDSQVDLSSAVQGQYAQSSVTKPHFIFFIS